MPCMNWSDLSSLQLGRYGEYYAKMEFTSYKYDVYTSEVDDHGVDFIARDMNSDTYFKVQVKSIRNGKYVFMRKNNMSPDDERMLICLLRFEDGKLPDVYIIPASAWKKPNAALVDRDYNKPGQKSKPEWGISLSKKNAHLLDVYAADKYFNRQKVGA